MKFLRRAFSFDRLIGLVMLTAFVLTYWADPFPVEFARNKTFDFFEKIQPRPIPAPGTSPVIIIDLDEDSLNEIGQWPWPRNIVADMVRNLFVMGVSVVGFNMVFAEPDRMNLADIADSLAGLDDETKEKLRGLSGNDQAFADILLQTRVVLGQAAYWEELDNAAKGPPVKKSVAMMMTKNGADPKKYIPNVTSLVRNIPVIEQAAAHKFGGHGIFSLVPELDGIVRRVPSLFVYDGEFYPSLSVEMLRLATGRQTIVVKTNVAGIKTMAIAKGMTVPTDKIGRMYPYYSKSDQSKYISARDVLNGTVDPNKIKGKLALVGTSAVGLLDIRSIPTEGIIAGVEVHAQIIENILEQNFLERPNYAQVAELALILVGGLMMIVLVPWIGARWTLLAFVIVAGGTVATSWALFTQQLALFDPVFPVGIIFLLYVLLTYTNYAREERQQRETRGAFAKYMSPAMVAKVVEDPTLLTLGGDKRNMTLLFCDVRGFTGISEQFGAEGLTVLINKLLTPLTNAILASEGTVDKYMGDCIMAFWNAPLDVPDHPRNACYAALDMMKAMGPLNDTLESEAIEEGRTHIPLKVGIGLNSGDAVVGNMGTAQRMDYSVLGDTVNTAARLEGQSKTYGVDIVIGPQTAERVPDMAVIELDLIQVKGKTVGLNIYALMGDPKLAQDPDFLAYKSVLDRMLAAYRGQKWDEAKVLLAECYVKGERYNLTELADLYAARIKAYEAEPPGADWNGVFIATSK